MDVVLAGTKPFALALFAPLTERTGSRPRIAPDPAQALALCGASTGLLVVEYGAAWLPALTRLRQQAPGLRIVAALPPGQEGAALSLSPLGVEAVPWDGQPATVVAAVQRLAAPQQAAPAPAPAAVRPAVAPPSAARPPPPVAAPAAPRPPPAPGPAPAPATAPQPPAVPAPVPATPPPAEPVDLFSDLGGTEATPVPGSTPAVDPVASAAPGPAAPPPYAGPPGAEARPLAAAWPAGAPSADEAESALVLYLRGKLGPDAPLAPVTRQAVAAMSELERQVVGGAAQPFDAGPIYRAAVLRLRVAAALATAPTTPAAVDADAVQRLLAELDAALAEVNPLAQGAPPDHRPALEAVRNALVREAVDFSEAAHRVTSAGPPPAEASARPAPRPGAPAARVLSVHTGAGDQGAEAPRKRWPLVVLILVLLAGAGYHLSRYLTAVPPPPVKTYDGAPAGTRALVTANGTWLVAGAGVTVDKAQLERFREQEAKKGNVLREVAPGRWKIEPAAPSGPGPEAKP